MKQKNSTFLERFSFAVNGIKVAFQQEASLKIQFLGLMFVILFCVIARPPAIWCAIFVGMCALVISLELVNTAIEVILDKIHPEFDQKIGFAKDCLAGAVLVASVASVAVFCIYLFKVMEF